MGKTQLTTNPGDYQRPSPQSSGPDLNQESGKTPFYKKKWFIAVAAAVVLIGAVAGMGDGKAPEDESTIAPPDSSVVVQTDTDVEPESEVESDDGAIKYGNYTLPCGMKLYFSDSVRNDVTGKWRISTTSDSVVPADCAMEYYQTMFSSDDEIHAVWNATLKTTTRFSVMSGLLFVDTMEYVKGEEHDANLLFSGMLLDSKIIDLKTGKPLEDEDETDEESSEAASSSQEQVSTESIAALIEVALPKEYTGKEVLYDDTSITINVWIDGVAAAATMIQAGVIDKESWETAKSGMLAMAKSCRELIDTTGRTDVTLTVNVLNDQNLDNTLLSILNTTVFYDALA